MIPRMALPVAVIVGRPNVGKSSLLNSLARRRISIVDPRAGVTRDRVSTVVEHDESYLEVIDTGGIGIIDDDALEEHVEDQIRFAISRADAIVFVVDVRDGVAPLDKTVAELLRHVDKPVIPVANKADDSIHEAQAGEFHPTRLRTAAVCVGSARPRPGRPAGSPARSPRPVRRGRADRPGDEAGRSSANATPARAPSSTPSPVKSRMIVSEIPGTTRDAVDVRFETRRPTVRRHRHGRRPQEGGACRTPDFYSYTRALRSIRRADVVLFLIDATVPVAEVDLKLAACNTQEEYKPVVITINKWDLAKEHARPPSEYADYLTRRHSGRCATHRSHS